MDINFEDGKVFCKLDEKLVASNVKTYVDQFKEVIGKDGPIEFIQIDLSETKTIDSMGITFLIGIYKSAPNKAGKTRLTGVSKDIYELLKIIKLDNIFEIELYE